jgi:hypothetical protein
MRGVLVGARHAHGSADALIARTLQPGVDESYWTFVQ